MNNFIWVILFYLILISMASPMCGALVRNVVDGNGISLEDKWYCYPPKDWDGISGYTADCVRKERE